MNTKDFSLYNYRRAIPTILWYQLISKAVFTLAMLLFRSLTGALLWNLGRPAVTSGDLPYIMRSWQGWALILCGFLALVLYTIFDVNATILISSRIIHNEKLKPVAILKDAVGKLKHFCSVRGVLVILYISLIGPLSGAAIGISLTTNFAIPDFIMSVIAADLIYKVVYNLLIIIFGVLGFIYVFTFHFVLLGDMDVREAMARSREIMKKNWKDFLKRYIGFGLRSFRTAILLGLVFYIIPMAVVFFLRPELVLRRTIVTFITSLAALIYLLYTLLILYFLMMKLTLIYERYTGEAAAEYTAYDRAGFRLLTVLSVPVILCMALFSLFCGFYYDDLFRQVPNVGVVAHRAGGDLAVENTLNGLEAAILYEAACAEIDVQRTKDGAYIINHDDTFERLCGEKRHPDEMTLAEIKTLRINDPGDPLLEPAEVATMEEFLDAAKGRIHLLIELKGRTADRQMAEDIYQMVKERDMVNEVSFIGLNYDLIEYVERTYPEINTGYLCFFGFGKIQNMSCNMLLLEAETATPENIERIHAVGKKVGVWTVNSYSTMLSFMMSDADYIITDKVEQVQDIVDLMEEVPDELRILMAFVLK